MSESQEHILGRTLELAGIKTTEKNFPKILSHGNSIDTIKNTHRDTNEKIQECLNNNSLGECIHITGEMRALTDPFHRYLCEEISQKSKSVFRVIYNLPEEHRDNPTKILKWNLESWATDTNNRKWHEELRTIYSIANRSVNLYALDTSNEIQYSVFGNKYILFQEKHKDRALKKHTWLLESESVNSALTDKAEKLIQKSIDIDGGNYRKFTKNLCSIASRRILSLLQKKHSMCQGEIISDNLIKDYTDNPQAIIDVLLIMNFIEKQKNCSHIKISTAGSEFIR